MTDRDNITLPRKHIDYAAHALEHFNKDAPDPLVSEIIHHLRAALAAEQPVPTDKDSLTVQSRLDAESFREERDEARALLNGVLQDIEALRRDAEQPRHPGYIIGSHWFEIAYERLCAGEAEDAILEDYEVVREPRLRDLRRDAERYRWLRERVRVWPTHRPMWAYGQINDAALWIKQSVDWTDDANIDAAIDAAMKGDET